MWFLNLLKSFITREKNERGAGLMTVLGVTLVLVVAASTITSSLIFSSNFTSAKLSENQANSEAESGIIDAISRYAKDPSLCKDNVEASDENGNKKYKFSVYRSTSGTIPTTVNSSGTQAGCPSTAESEADRWILIESTGFGKDKTSAKKTAVYKVNPKHMSVIPQSITANNVSLTNSTQINKGDGVLGDNKLYITNTFKCDVDAKPGVVINGNITYKSSTDFGGFPENQNCLINGNMNIDITDTAITSTDLSKFTSHGGYICSKGTSIPNANAPKDFLSQKPAGKMFNKASECIVEGTRYGYVPDMSDSIKATTEACTNWDTLKSEIESASSANNGEETFFDLTVCGSGGDTTKLRKIMYDESNSNREITLRGNVNLVFNTQFLLKNSVIKSSSSKPYTINFIVPSKTASETDSNGSGIGNSYFSNVKYDSGISGIVYTAGNFITYSGTIINGQIYAGGSYTASGTTTFNYMPVGLPNAEVKIKDIGISKDLIRVY